MKKYVFCILCFLFSFQSFSQKKVVENNKDSVLMFNTRLRDILDSMSYNLKRDIDSTKGVKNSNGVTVYFMNYFFYSSKLDLLSDSLMKYFRVLDDSTRRRVNSIVAEQDSIFREEIFKR